MIENSYRRFLGKLEDFDNDDLEVIIYGTKIILFSLFEIFIIVLCAYFIERTFEAVLFLTTLLYLRKRVGGIHSNSYIQCMITTFIVCFASIGINEVIVVYGSEPLSKLLLLVGSLLIIRFAPKDTKNRKFNEKERIIFRIKSLEALCITILISYFLSIYDISLSGMIDVTVLVQGLVIINLRRLYYGKENCKKIS